MHQHKIKRENLKRKKTFSMPLDDINLAFGRCLSLINPHTRLSDDTLRWLFFLCFSCFLFAVFFVVQCSVYILINSTNFHLFPQRRSDCRGKKHSLFICHLSNAQFSSVFCSIFLYLFPFHACMNVLMGKTSVRVDLKAWWRKWFNEISF